MDSLNLIIFTVAYAIPLLGALYILGAACVSDFRTMTIPNTIPIALCAAFFLAYLGAMGIHYAEGPHIFGPFRAHLLAFGIMLALTFLMFVFKVWGAGDAKLAAAVGLWVGLKGFMAFLTIMSIAGLGLVVLCLVIKKTKFRVDLAGPESWPVLVRSGNIFMPYGIAIAIGAAGAFYQLGYFNILP